MRQGYLPFLAAQTWMKKNKGRDVSVQVGGVMQAGVHQARVVEVWQSKDWNDIIFRSVDNMLHKERCFGRSRTRYRMNGLYQFELAYATDGNCRIEAAGGTYYLLHLISGARIFESEVIKDVYAYVKEHSFKLAYLKIKWAKEML